MSFFDKLLVEDTSSEAEVPVEALFNDLAVSGLVPLEVICPSSILYMEAKYAVYVLS